MKRKSMRNAIDLRIDFLEDEIRTELRLEKL